MKRATSLRNRLLLGGALGVIAAALCAALLLGAAFERSAQRALDRRLGDDLDKLIALAEVAPDGRVILTREPVDERYDRIFSGWYWGARVGDDVRQSRSSWDSEALVDALRDATPTRTPTEIEGPRSQRLRVLAQQVRFPNGATLQAAVAGDLSELRAEARDFRVLAAAAVALLALALLLAMLLQIRYGLRPLARVSDTLTRLRQGDDVRFDAGALPSEVAPLALQVNELLDDHARRVERARNSAQDLAHALKTPLTALALQGEQPGPELARDVATQVQRMRSAIDRHLVGHLGADARRRTPISPPLHSLRELMRRAHADRGIAIDITCPPEAMFPGAPDDLEELLGNLLDNACKWARERVEVSVAEDASGLRITIDDDGPGMDTDAAASALERGVRLDQRVPGSGLGLSIVDAIVAAHGGTLELQRAPLGGLRAEARFQS
jgi:signal transduction histidine kinase